MMAWAAGALTVALPAPGLAQDADAWRFRASVYAYLPTISGSTAFPSGAGGSGASVDVDQILENLKFTFMGSFEAQRGQLGFFTDVVYLNVGDSKSGSRALAIGGTDLPAGASARSTSTSRASVDAGRATAYRTQPQRRPDRRHACSTRH
jgi:hypothetical protein